MPPGSEPGRRVKRSVTLPVERKKGLIPHDWPRGLLPKGVVVQCQKVCRIFVANTVDCAGFANSAYGLSHSMAWKEVIGSIPIRSTNQFNNLRVFG